MRKILLASIFIILAATTLQAADTLDVYFIDVGHGDAILIDYGDWECLIDAGYKNAWPSSGENRALLTALVKPPLETFILSHADQDHYSAFEYLACWFRFGQVLHGPNALAVSKMNTCLTDAYSECPDYYLPSAKVHALSANPSQALAGMELDWRVLHPSQMFAAQQTDKNENSLVLLLKFGSVSFLFVGDIEDKAEDELDKLPDLEGPLVLKVSHHGSDSSTTSEFLDWADPELAIISADADDLHEDTRETLGLYGVPFLQTSNNGTICVSTDGTAFSVRTDFDAEP